MMGLETYLQKFDEKIAERRGMKNPGQETLQYNDWVDVALPAAERRRQSIMITTPVVGKYPLVNNEDHFFKDIGPIAARIMEIEVPGRVARERQLIGFKRMFCDIHAEEEVHQFLYAYNANIPAMLEREDGVAALPATIDRLAEEARNLFNDKLLVLPNTINKVFGFLLRNNCEDDVWKRVINIFTEYSGPFLQDKFRIGFEI